MSVRKVLMKFSRVIPDKVFINIKFFKFFGHFVDFNNPKTYNEKLQWLKIYNRDPLYNTFVDKYLVKEYVAKKIGEQYIIPLLGKWNSFDEIDFDKLPDQFVLKCNHDCGGIVICRDKSSFDKVAAKKKLEEHLKENYYWQHREWPYKDVKPCIFAEKYMVDESGYELKDYKWFCFDGEPKVLFIAQDRENENEDTKFDFYDMAFNHLPIKNGHPNANAITEKPEGFDEMYKLAQVLSKGIPHVRVDFYNINGKIYFGELTLFHWSGFVKFEPKEWDKIFGDWIKLPKVKKV